jgi:hypothetical protein
MQSLAAAQRENGLDGLSIDEMEVYWQRAKGLP